MQSAIGEKGYATSLFYNAHFASFIVNTFVPKVQKNVIEVELSIKTINTMYASQTPGKLQLN